MISIKIEDNKITCNISNDIKIDISHFPLKFQVLELITNNILWEVELNKGMWASWNNIRDVNTRVITSDEIVLKEFNYDYSNEYLPIYEFWDYFCRIHKNSTGLILGAGNGTWGEWVIPINREGIKCHLVEASDKTFLKLEETYKGKNQYNLHNILISTDGLDYKFYEGNYDCLNTINLDYLNKIDNTSNLNYTLKKSKSINEFLKEIGFIDWIRIDLEGIDYDIIKSMDKEYIRKLSMIQYEHYHLPDDKREEIDSIIIPLGFDKIVYNIDTIYVKIQH